MSKFENLWSLMEKYTFELDPDSSSEDLRCLLCKKLMIDACQTACGCQFCYKCIEDHTKSGDTYCPGGKDSCMEEFLVLERDILRNMRINNRIYKLSVLCPNQMCQSKIEMSKMEEHLRVCTNGVSVCPYESLGCGKLQNHIHNDTFSHTQLVVEWITNLRNEMDASNDQFHNTRLEVQSLKEGHLSDINNLEDKVKEFVEGMQQKMDNAILQINLQRGEIEIVKEESRQKDKMIETTNEKLEEFRLTTEARLTAIVDSFERKQEGVKKEMMEVSSTDKALNDNLHKRMDSLQKEMSAVREEMDSGRSIFKRNDSLESPARIDFSWTITNASNTKKTIYSDGFYSKGYKFCLSAFCHVNYMSLWCYIMKGRNDATLPWPMKQHITLSVLDQSNSKPYKSMTFHHDTYRYKYKEAFSQPVNHRNEYSIGNNAFLTFSTIPQLDSVLFNDTLVVTCTIGDQPPESNIV